METKKYKVELSASELVTLRNSLVDREDTKIALSNLEGQENIKIINGIDVILKKIEQEQTKPINNENQN